MAEKARLEEQLKNRFVGEKPGYYSNLTDQATFDNGQSYAVYDDVIGDAMERAEHRAQLEAAQRVLEEDDAVLQRAREMVLAQQMLGEI